jgi:hypothetical protein
VHSRYKKINFEPREVESKHLHEVEVAFDGGKAEENTKEK